MNLDAGLNDADLAETFARDGYVIFKDFYDYEKDIRPIREYAREIIALTARRHGVVVPCATAEEAMSDGFMTLIVHDRSWGAEVYDAVKQIPDFIELVATPRNTELFKKLRPGSVPGIAGGGFGIRIDNPREDKFRAAWHQEFPAQLRSLDGVVFWSPLVVIDDAIGPVQLCPGSHREGPVPVYEDDGGVGQTGAYALRLDREEERRARYATIAPLTKPGDLLVMDFLTLHASGVNVSSRPRWSMQWRLFNFLDPVGVKIGWRGSFAAGVKYQDVLPELVAG